MDTKSTYQSPKKNNKDSDKSEEKPVAKSPYAAAMRIGVSMLAPVLITFIVHVKTDIHPLFQFLLLLFLLQCFGAFSYFVIENKKGGALDELAALITFVGIVVFIVLICIYQTWLDFSEFKDFQVFLTLLIPLGLLLMYVFDSYLLFGCISVLLLALSSEELTFGFEFFRNVLFAGLMFPFLKTKLKDKDLSRGFLQIFALPYLLFVAIAFSGLEHPGSHLLTPLTGLFASILSMLGFIFVFSLNEIRRGTSIQTSPWCFHAYLPFAIFILSASFSDVPGLDLAVAPPHLFFLLSMMAASFFMAYKNLKEGKITSFMTDLVISLYQLSLVIICFAVPPHRPISNMFTLAIICCLMAEGIATKRLFIMNLGFLTLLIYLTISSVLVTPLIALLLGVAGIGFVAANYSVYKQIKKSPDRLPADSLAV